jgi:hypothetical protein
MFLLHLLTNISSIRHPDFIKRVFHSEQNILRRLDVQTDMSSIFLNWTSNLAIDGNIGPKPDVCNCCSGTKNSLISWWTVDLGKRYPINSVTVFSREFGKLKRFMLDKLERIKTMNIIVNHKIS